MTVPRLSRLTGTYTKPTLGRRLRRYLLVGLVVTAPIGVTVWILLWLFTSIDSILGGAVREFTGRSLPGVGLVILLVLLLMIGWVVHRAAGRKMLDFWNKVLSQFPLAGRIYNAVSQIVQTVIGSRRRLFIKTVLVPYPMEGSWAVAFVTNEDAAELSAIIGEPCVNVFLPTTPNPTSGFMLAVPVSKVRDFDTTVEEAMKLIVSAGAVRARVSRKGIDVESLLMDTREWKRKEAAERRVKTGPRQDGPGRRKTD